MHPEVHEEGAATHSSPAAIMIDYSPAIFVSPSARTKPMEAVGVCVWFYDASELKVRLGQLIQRGAAGEQNLT